MNDQEKHAFVGEAAVAGGYQVIVETGRSVLSGLGASGIVLPWLLNLLDGPALFWLDAHYVAEDGVGGDSSPLAAELDALLAWPHAARSTVLIDNVGCMGRAGWPTLAEIRARADCVWARSEDDDIMRLTPKE